jgi:hypothetical protein
MILRAASRALQEILDAAYWDYGNNEEERNKAHSLFLDEIAYRTTLATTHLRGRELRAPGEEVRADNEEKRNHVEPCISRSYASNPDSPAY